jgi:hypothetical protein
MTKISREEIGKHLLEMQLQLIGKDLMVLIDDDRWRFNNPMSMTQFLSFKHYALEQIQKTYKCNSKKRDVIWDQFYELFGLRIKN